jgi:sigma-E factor negative regulatory protein RseB
MILKKSKPAFPPSVYGIILTAYLFLNQTAGAAEAIQADARDLLDRMGRATRELNYDGIFIYRREHGMDTMRLIHRSGQDGETERLITLDGQPREVIRTKDSVTCIFPENRQILIEKSRAHKLPFDQFPEALERIGEYYRFAVAGEDRIAGKDAWVVEIVPGDEYRYGYRLWIDKENHLLLKSELDDKTGMPVEQILFTQLEVLESIPDDLLKPATSGTDYTLHNSSTIEHYREAKGVYWKTGWLPRGFALVNYEQKLNAEDADAVEHLIYTDGLAMVSVFVEQADANPDFKPGGQRLGAVNAFSEVTNGYVVTAVGEAPYATVRGMATSVVSGNR